MINIINNLSIMKTESEQAIKHLPIKTNQIKKTTYHHQL